MAGRKTKLTPEVQDLIVEGINAGLTLELTCARAGVDPATFYRWLEKGEAAQTGVFCEFCDTVSRARECGYAVGVSDHATGSDGLAGGGVPARRSC